jgi:hypothetical protein
MTYRYYPDGFSDTVGTDVLSYADDIYLTADGGASVFHVNSETGSNTTGAGTRASPYATIAHALTLAGAFDVIFVHEGHEETFTATQSITTAVIVIGEGEGTDRPLLTNNVASNGDMWTVTGAMHIRNLRFAANAQANTSPTIDASAAGANGIRISYCDFDCGEYDTGTKVNVFSGGGILRGCTFTSSATAYSARPSKALAGAGWVFGCTFTGGTYGWQNASELVSGWDNEASGPIGITVSGICQCAMSGDAYFSGTPSFVAHSGLGRIGHPLLAGEGLFLASGLSMVWVDSTHPQASDSAGYGKVDRPYATLKYAINTGAANGLFIVAAGHTETITSAAVTVDQTTAMIVGEGGGTNRPLLTRGYDGIAIDLDTLVTAALLANVRFAESTVSSTATRVVMDSGYSIVYGCAFDCGSYDVGTTVRVADLTVVWSSEFTSVATSSTTQPLAAVATNGSYSNIDIIDCTFDGGAKGWSSGGTAVSLECFDVFIENISLLRDSSIYIAEVGGYATGIEAFVQVGTTTGAGLVTIG